MSQAGTNGTDGTDVGTVLTTQGDILYRDGSGLQRLPKGTANQVLQMNSGATAPEYADASGGDVILVSETASTSGTAIEFQDIFSSTYKYYHVKFAFYHASSGYGFPWFRFLSSGGNMLTASDYNSTFVDFGMALNNSSNNYSAFRNYHENYGRLHSDQVGIASNRRSYFDFWFYEPNNSSTHPVMRFSHTGFSETTWVEPNFGNIVYDSGTAFTGFRLQDGNGVNIYVENFKCYGYK
jgi:hypothetical protein